LILKIELEVKAGSFHKFDSGYLIEHDLEMHPILPAHDLVGLEKQLLDVLGGCLELLLRQFILIIIDNLLMQRVAVVALLES